MQALTADFFVSPAAVYKNVNAACIMGNKALGSLVLALSLSIAAFCVILTKAVLTFHIFTTQISINSHWKNTYLAPLSI